MSELILHHYDEAPFAEKIRLVFGIKGLAWHSVIVPSAMPKPFLMPLTGGYRRTPVLQIGADIYIDTQLIAAELERRYPQPSIFPDGNAGLGYALGSWANGPYVVTSVAIYMGATDPFAGEVQLPAHFFEDRKKMWMTQFDADQLGPKLPGYRTRLRAHTEFILMQLADGRAFLTGDKPWSGMMLLGDKQSYAKWGRNYVETSFSLKPGENKEVHIGIEGLYSSYASRALEMTNMQCFIVYGEQKLPETYFGNFYLVYEEE